MANSSLVSVLVSTPVAGNVHLASKMADTPGSGDGAHGEGDKKPETVKPAESPKPERVNLTLRSLMPSPINHAARRNKAEARLRKMVRPTYTPISLKPIKADL